jgi:AcrR family transcriptional regulator
VDCLGECQTVTVRKTKRPYHHGDLRSALLNAAERALEAGKGHELSLRELSRELGVSNTAPRRHFITKQALFDALAIEGFERLEAALGRSVADKEVDFDARIVKLARSYARFATKHPALMRLMSSAKHAAGASAELLEASRKAIETSPLMVISEGQAAGAVIQGEPHRLGLVVFSAVEGLVAICANGKLGGVSLDALVVDVVGKIILGLRPRS